jgi:23S rRNA-intervening sequence protein
MAISKPARTFQDLLVWQKAHRFVLEVYAFTAAFPKQETYGLHSRCAVQRYPFPPTSPRDSIVAAKRTRLGS